MFMLLVNDLFPSPLAGRVLNRNLILDTIFLPCHYVPVLFFEAGNHHELEEGL
jgi:hypothetical protein